MHADHPPLVPVRGNRRGPLDIGSPSLFLRRGMTPPASKQLCLWQAGPIWSTCSSGASPSQSTLSSQTCWVWPLVAPLRQLPRCVTSRLPAGWQCGPVVVHQATISTRPVPASAPRRPPGRPRCASNAGDVRGQLRDLIGHGAIVHHHRQPPRRRFPWRTTAATHAASRRRALRWCRASFSITSSRTRAASAWPHRLHHRADQRTGGLYCRRGPSGHRRVGGDRLSTAFDNARRR